MDNLVHDLGNLIALYVGRGNTFPEVSLVPVFAKTNQCDRDVVAVLLAKIIAELKDVQPDWQSRDLIQNSKYAADSVHQLYPEMGAIGRDSLEWLYAWWWK